jgi:hypothetical protein
MSIARLSTFRLSRCNPLLFGFVFLLVQVGLSSCLVGWMKKEIKNKNIISKNIYSKCGLVLFVKMLETER